MKNLMDINSYAEYYHHITPCQELMNALSPSLDNINGTLSYCITEELNEYKQHILPHPIVVSVQNTPLKQKITDSEHKPITDIPELNVPDLKSHPGQPHAGNNWDNLSEQSDDENSWSKTQTMENFSIIHSMVCHTINEWEQLTPSKIHSFYNSWQKAKYHGLQSNTTWDHVRTTLRIHNYGEYISYINKCPKVMETHHIVWDEDNNTLHHTLVKPPTAQKLDRETTKITQYFEKLKQTASAFDLKIHTLNIRMDETNTKVVYCQEMVENQLYKGATK